MDESPTDYLISLPLAGALLWYVFTYHGESFVAVIRWLEAIFPI